MDRHTVTLFSSYPFAIGQKIRIKGSNRRGDWEVIGLDDKKIRLRCPVSGREVEWARFCYLVTEKENTTWPQVD
jgi:hypothetical protein